MNDPNIRIINSSQYAVHGTILFVGNSEQVDYRVGNGDTYTYPNPNNYLVNRIENASDFPDLGVGTFQSAEVYYNTYAIILYTGELMMAPVIL